MRAGVCVGEGRSSALNALIESDGVRHQKLDAIILCKCTLKRWCVCNSIFEFGQVKSQ